MAPDALVHVDDLRREENWDVSATVTTTQMNKGLRSVGLMAMENPHSFPSTHLHNRNGRGNTWVLVLSLRGQTREYLYLFIRDPPISNIAGGDPNSRAHHAYHDYKPVVCLHSANNELKADCKSYFPMKIKPGHTLASFISQIHTHLGNYLLRHKIQNIDDDQTRPLYNGTEVFGRRVWVIKALDLLMHTDPKRAAIKYVSRMGEDRQCVVLSGPPTRPQIIEILESIYTRMDMGRADSTGRPYPGSAITVIGADGRPANFQW